MRRRFVRSKWLLGLSLFLLLSTTVLVLPTHSSQVQAQETQQTKYLIENFETKQCLDTGNQTRGNPYQFECNPNNPAQQWVLESNSAGGNLPNIRTLRNVGGGVCLDHGNATTPGFQVYLFDCYNGPGQAFSLDAVISNPDLIALENIKAVSSGLVLDGFGTNPYLFTDQSNNDYQLWVLRRVT